MTTFDKREEGFEKKFALDEELLFKAGARRNKLLGLWAAEKLGISGAEADAYAKETFGGKPLAEALKTLSVKSLSTLHPHPWYVFVNYSHPPLLERLERLEG